ncbi:MAG: GDSL family lipase [Actinobacteria bacterium 13_1_20CM_3_71_11]|nr:MAG: GDSL family lipase [Actinobacteria bacterium 13_1_20CM_3_71_11]
MKRGLALLAAAVLALVALACKGGGPDGLAGGSAPAAKDLPSSMAALGDSITAGYGTCLSLSACPRNSWATGDGVLVDSHYKRILAGNPAIKGHAVNLATAGATIDDLPGQATAAVGHRPDYVAILIGANDACRSRLGDMTGTTEFEVQATVALTALRAGLPKARVLVVSIPDVYRVWEVAHPNRAAREVWALGVCPTLLANPTSTAPADVARRQQFRDRITAYNTILAKACKDFGPRCRYDGGAVHNATLGIDDLSPVDYFHPSATGESALADACWPGSFTWG